MREADKNFGSLAQQILDGSMDEVIDVGNITSSGVFYNTSERVARDKSYFKESLKMS